MSKSKLILIFIIIAAVSLIYYKINRGSICLFYNIYGMPCPTCGMTRAYNLVLEFNFRRAFEYHPLFWLVPFLLIVYKNKKIFYWIVLIFVFVWIIRLYLYFPNKKPLEFNNNAIFPRIYRMIVEK